MNYKESHERIMKALTWPKTIMAIHAEQIKTTIGLDFLSVNPLPSYWDGRLMFRYMCLTQQSTGLDRICYNRFRKKFDKIAKVWFPNYSGLNFPWIVQEPERAKVNRWSLDYEYWNWLWEFWNE